MTRPHGTHRPPMRDGVSASCVSMPPGQWATTLDFLCERFDRIPRADWHARMARGDVINALGQALPPDAAYQTRSLLYYFREPAPEVPIPFEEAVLYLDDHLLVADKPHFLPVMPSGRYLQETLLVRLKRKLGLADLVPIHRIDRDTAGLVMFSTNPRSRGAYAALFRNRLVHKRYEAVAPWRDDLSLPRTEHCCMGESSNFMCMQVLDGTPNAETTLSLLEHSGHWARYLLQPRTGRRHQLRVQMSALGIPIRHDNIYPVLSPEIPQGQQPDFTKPLQLLAQGLTFDDPLTGGERVFESRLQLQAL